MFTSQISESIIAFTINS